MFLRGVPCDQTSFLTDLKVLDDIVIDQCPTIDHYVKNTIKKLLVDDSVNFITLQYQDFVPKFMINFQCLLRFGDWNHIKRLVHQ